MTRRGFAQLWRRLRGGDLSRTRASASVAVGLFIGSLPLFGLHLPLCLAVCLPLRLDAVSAYIAANVSNPLFAPFLLTAEVEIGSLLLHGRLLRPDLEQLRQSGLSGVVAQLALGAPLVGAALAVLGGLVAWTLLGRRGPREPGELDGAIERTVARYADAPRGDRYYVASKLYTDPVVEQLGALDGPLGRVVDAACGRGQLGLCLLELGRVQTLCGFDVDPRKVRVARSAAGEAARYEVADLCDVSLPATDTLLLIDVLHYLEPARQDELLERAAGALSPGGRLLVRELDAGRGWRALPGMLAERVARGTGYNRGTTLAFRPLAEIVTRLEELGLQCRVERAGSLSNALIVARRPLTPSD